MPKYWLRGRAGCCTVIFVFQFLLILACLVYISIISQGQDVLEQFHSPRPTPEYFNETGTTKLTTTPSFSTASTSTGSYSSSSDTWFPSTLITTEITPIHSSTPVYEANCDNSTVDECPPVCPELDDPNGTATYFPFPISTCRQFYECSNGYPQCFMCPSDTVWDQEILSCVNPLENFTCPFSTTPPFYSTTTSAEITVTYDPIIVCAGNDQGIRRHRYNCTLFYVCNVDMAPCLLSCPHGLYFNPKLCVCDWPYMVVDCENGIPSGEDEDDICVLN